jgi:hypothetical protein
MLIFGKAMATSIFRKMIIFNSFSTHFYFHSSKMRHKMEVRIGRKWPENVYCEQPYYTVSFKSLSD